MLLFFSQEDYGDKLSHNKTATNTLRLYHSEQDLQDFFKGSQAKFWEKNGHPFVKLSPEEIKEMLPTLDQENLGNPLYSVDSTFGASENFLLISCLK